MKKINKYILSFFLLLFPIISNASFDDFDITIDNINSTYDDLVFDSTSGIWYQGTRENETDGNTIEKIFIITDFDTTEDDNFGVFVVLSDGTIQSGGRVGSLSFNCNSQSETYSTNECENQSYGFSGSDFIYTFTYDSTFGTPLYATYTFYSTGGYNRNVSTDSDSFYTGTLTLSDDNFQIYNTDYTLNSGTDLINANGPEQIEIISEGTVFDLVNGIIINSLDVSVDYKLSYDITEYDSSNIGNIVDSGDLGSYSGGVNNIYIYNNDNFSFQSLGLYDVGLYFVNSEDSSDTHLIYYNADYNYYEEYVETVESDFSFSVTGFTFFENGFSLDNFLPNPYGGDLYFEITSPNGTGTTVSYTETYGPYETDGNGYGYDSSVIVTSLYHLVAGQYQVRVLYSYGGVTVFPFGEEYSSYTITLAETLGDDPLLQLDDCEIDGDTLTCLNETGFFEGVKDFFTNTYQTISKIQNLFYYIQDMSNQTESKDFLSFIIPKTNANVVLDTGLYDNFDESSIEDIPVFKNSYTLGLSLSLFITFIMLFGIIYSIRKS